MPKCFRISTLTRGVMRNYPVPRRARDTPPLRFLRLAQTWRNRSCWSTSASPRLKHYSIRTEEAYARWVRRFVLFHRKRHPRERGSDEVVAFLSFLAEEEQVAASTQNQALFSLPRSRCGGRPVRDSSSSLMRSRMRGILTAGLSAVSSWSGRQPCAVPGWIQ